MNDTKNISSATLLSPACFATRKDFIIIIASNTNAVLKDLSKL